MLGDPLTPRDIPALATGKIQLSPKSAGRPTAAWREGGTDWAGEARTAMPHKI